MQHYILPKIDEVFKPYLAVSILSWIFIVLNKIRNLPELKFEKKLIIIY
jgi:small basic protein